LLKVTAVKNKVSYLSTGRYWGSASPIARNYLH